MILNDGIIDIALPDELRWTDELDWTAVAAQDARTLGGAMVRQTSVKVAGRPITLAPPDGFFGTLLLGTLRTLRGWTDDPDKVMTLTFADNGSYTVKWRYPNPIKASPLLPHSTGKDNEVWLPTFNLITVET